MTREEAQKHLSEVITRLKYNRPAHVHVCEISPRDCEEFYNKLTRVEQYIRGPEAPELRKVASRLLAHTGEGHYSEGVQVVVVQVSELVLLCDAILTLTVPSGE